MKILIISSLFGLLFLSSTVQNSIDADLLLNKNWDIYKTVEVLAGDTTIYHVYREKTSGKTRYSSNVLGGNILFTSDSTGYYDAWPKETFTWKTIGTQHIKINIDSLLDRSGNRHFFGSMRILELTDSTAVLRKDISRNGRWTRTFYLNTNN